MDIEKTLTVAAPAAQVWSMLLDPHVMAGCVPGMQSIEVLSEDEYVALMQVKISFISAKFKLKTRIVERRAPHYLRTEGTGEDTSVASSLKQQSEIFLEALPNGQTELRMKVQVDVMGRLGTFGLSVMKTKADRMWDEFARNLAARLAPEALAATDATPAPAQQLEASPAPTAPALAQAPAPDTGRATATRHLLVEGLPGAPAQHMDSWWARLLGRAPMAAPGSRSIHIEIQRGDTTIRVDWPVEHAKACADWLLEAQDRR